MGTTIEFELETLNFLFSNVETALYLCAKFHNFPNFQISWMEITGCYSQMTHTKLYTISLSVKRKYDTKLLTMWPVLKSGLELQLLCGSWLSEGKCSFSGHWLICRRAATSVFAVAFVRLADVRKLQILSWMGCLM